MIEGATVTLPLGEFDELRSDREDLRNLIRRIAAYLNDRAAQAERDSRGAAKKAEVVQSET